MSLIDSIISAESGGNPNARNPNSSATGAGQFLTSTWLDTISRARPDLVQGKTTKEILALRTNPEISREMTEAYAAQNGAILSKAGLPVTPGSTYLAHFAGPQGAVAALSADPSAPVSSVMSPAALKANPFLQGMTVGDLRAWADRKMGGQKPAPQAAPAPAMAAQTPQPAAHLSPQAEPIFAQAPQQQPAQFDIPQIQAAPIFTPPRKQVDLSKLRAAFKAPQFYRG